jgi:predicted nucleic acid-binding protein
MRFLDEIKPTLHLVPYDHSVRQSAEEVFRRYTASRPLSFCDILSFVVVTTMLNSLPCFSFDQDFLSLGLTVLQ